MTRDDVIKLAIEAGDDVEHTLPSDLDFLERFAALVAAAERGDVALSNATSGEPRAARAIAQAIRARGDA